jgi:ATP-dependent helicase/DNAse subunit B
MPLELVLGPANSAKAGEVLGAFAAVARRGAMLVVPTAADVVHYRRELTQAGGVLGTVLTFPGLAEEVARRAGYTGRRVTSAQREELLRVAVRGTRLQSMAGLEELPGFRRAAGALITELERSLVTPARFAGAIRAWTAQEPALTAYGRDLAQLYDHYRAELERAGRVDAELYAWSALDALRAAPARWGRDPVFFYGFDDLTGLERDAIETLSRVVGAQVTVSLNFEPGRAALQARAEVVGGLRPLADEVVELASRDDHYAPSSRAALHHLERSLFETDAARVDPGPVIQLLESGGERAEAELVASRILELQADGIRGEEIAVVYRSCDKVAPLVRAVFGEYGVTVAGPIETPFGHTGLGQAVCAAARCALAEDEAEAADLLSYLRAPGVLPDPAHPDALEAALLRSGLDGVRVARQRLGTALPALDALAGAADPAAELCRLAQALFTAPRAGRAPVLGADEIIDARALALLTRTVQELAELDRRPRGRELLELLDELVVSDGGSEAHPGAVLLTEPLQIRARRFRVVFACGLQEGEFPLPAGPEPFLSDARRWELAQRSGLRLRPHEDVLDRERYLFYATVSRATEQVVLSYRSSDEEGNLALPSPFLADVTAVLAPDFRDRRRRRLLADVVWPAAEAPTSRELAKARAAASAPVTGGDEPPERRLGALARGRLRHTQILSPGALEAYGDCPVRWLIERELRPQPLAPDPEPMVRGNLMHAVLERLLTELDGPLTPATLAEAQQTMSALVSELAPTVGARLGAGLPRIVRAGALRAIEADLRRYLAHEAASTRGWRPLGLELQFGFEDEDSLPALELGDAEDPVRLRGVIDRVDTDGAGRALIRDYKSGGSRSEYPAARWATDRRLQVALYLVAVRELTGLDPVGGFYQPLRGEDLRARGIYLDGVDLGPGVVGKDATSAEELAATLTSAEERAGALAAALRSGDVTPCPQTCSREGCAYPAICRSQ